MSIPVVGTDEPEVMAQYYGMSVKEMTAAGVFYMSGYTGSQIAQFFGLDRESCEVSWPLTPEAPLAVAEGDEQPVDDNAGDGGGSADDPAVDG